MMDECKECTVEEWCLSCQDDFYEHLKESEPDYYNEKFGDAGHFEALRPLGAR